jgi:hypothetical protein
MFPFNLQKFFRKNFVGHVRTAAAEWRSLVSQPGSDGKILKMKQQDGSINPAMPSKPGRQDFWKDL